MPWRARIPGEDFGARKRRAPARGEGGERPSGKDARQSLPPALKKRPKREGNATLIATTQ